MKPYFVLQARDGRFVTNDTRAGASLTNNAALCYVWESKERAEIELEVYQVLLGTRLSLERRPSR